MTPRLRLALRLVAPFAALSVLCAADMVMRGIVPPGVFALMGVVQ